MKEQSKVQNAKLIFQKHCLSSEKQYNIQVKPTRKSNIKFQVNLTLEIKKYNLNLNHIKFKYNKSSNQITDWNMVDHNTNNMQITHPIQVNSIQFFIFEFAFLFIIKLNFWNLYFWIWIPNNLFIKKLLIKPNYWFSQT